MAADRRRIEWEFDVIAGNAAQVIQAEGAGADMILMGDRSATGPTNLAVHFGI